MIVERHDAPENNACPRCGEYMCVSTVELFRQLDQCYVRLEGDGWVRKPRVSPDESALSRVSAFPTSPFYVLHCEACGRDDVIMGPYREREEENNNG